MKCIIKINLKLNANKDGFASIDWNGTKLSPAAMMEPQHDAAECCVHRPAVCCLHVGHCVRWPFFADPAGIGLHFSPAAGNTPKPQGHSPTHLYQVSMTDINNS